MKVGTGVGVGVGAAPPRAFAALSLPPDATFPARADTASTLLNILLLICDADMDGF
ncbi:MAG: hypothetical protein BWY05_01070 [Euryarchaeota archaeon ADurb.Bin165]|nr:MAG: hypothetical protein BWY05_01070 [Euryarchaeota archaeon ADurb.Bin165]